MEAIKEGVEESRDMYRSKQSWDKEVKKKGGLSETGQVVKRARRN